MEPTTSSYAVLALLAARPWSAYELARQAPELVAWAWPRSERHLYDEPKRLVGLGFATASPQRRGGRARTEYRITPTGRRALRAWLATPPEPATLEIEGLLRLLAADQAPADALRLALETAAHRTRERTAEVLAPLARAGLDGTGPLPDRVHLLALAADFCARFDALVTEWTEDALEEIERWDDTRGVGLTVSGRRTFERIVARYGDPASPDGA